jgi:4-amino-4-deoxy-L-arabinose transferase-like glycosyltransferase
VIQPGQPTAFRAPGFPLVLALLYWFSYSNSLLAYLLFCVIGAATSMATYRLARELLPESLARVSACLLALYFGHIYATTLFLSEGLFALSVALGLWAFLIHL